MQASKDYQQNLYEELSKLIEGVLYHNAVKKNYTKASIQETTIL